MVMKTYVVMISVCLTFIVGVAYGEIIYVPGDYPTIQAGIDAASSGDTVLVADGTYTGRGNKNLDLNGKSITVTSENGPWLTTIDCEGRGRGFYFHSGETSSSVVSGFTITNGSIRINGRGGGISCVNSSSPTIEYNIIAGNSASWGGGGIYCNSSSPTIRYNEITGNSAGWGGGIGCITSSSPTIIGNTITNNEAPSYDGGGIYSRASSPTIIGNEISGNRAGSAGPPVGGWGGGGIFCINTSSMIQNNIITDNLAAYDGGGIRSLSSSLSIINNTITGNTASDGGGIAGESASSLTVLNTILWGNSPEEISIDASSGIDITYSDVQGGWSGTGNTNADPLFGGDYHLSNSSPCIGVGIMTPDVLTEDFEGDPRPNPIGSMPDMGADENPN